MSCYPLTLRHLQAQVYCSEVVKMPRKELPGQACPHLPQVVPADLDKDSLANVRWGDPAHPSWGRGQGSGKHTPPNRKNEASGPCPPASSPPGDCPLPCHTSI